MTSTTIMIILRDGYPVSKIFFITVQKQIEEVLHALVANANYTTEMLCGAEFWNLLTDGEKRLAGHCLAHLVSENLLPLVPVKTRHEYPKRYRLQ